MKEEFDHMNAQISPEESLNAKVLVQAASHAKAPRRFRSLVAVAAMLALVLLATPVMADCIPWILERIAPHLVETYDPVLLSDTDNGITLEVVAATVQDNVVEMVIKYQGDILAGPNGVAPYFDIQAMGCNAITLYALRDYEGYWNDITHGIYYSQVFLKYPPDTTLEEIRDREVSVILENMRISGFTSDDLEIPLVFTDPDTLTVTNTAHLKELGFTNFGEGVADEYVSVVDPGSCVMLPSGDKLYEVNDNLYLSGAAYIDGKLHVQLAAVGTKSGYGGWDYTVPCLLDAQGNEILVLYSNSFYRDKVDYREFVFDIPQEKLENCTLSVQPEYHDLIPCNCQVTFRISDLEYTTE